MHRGLRSLIRSWWGAHDVRHHQTGSKRLRHPVVGELAVQCEVMQLTADRGLGLAVCTAEPGSRSAECLRLLCSWAASERAAVAPPVPLDTTTTTTPDPRRTT